MIRFDSDDLPFGFDASDEALDQTDPTLEELEDDASWDDDDGAFVIGPWDDDDDDSDFEHRRHAAGSGEDDDSDFEHPDDAEEPDDDGWN